MGRTFHFECPYCLYRASVSGGADAGINCSIQTIFCHDCRELFDVFIRIRRKEKQNGESGKNGADFHSHLLPMKSSIPPAMLIDEPWPEYPPTRLHKPARKTFWETVKAACPVSKKHHVEFWHDPGRCPRCGNYLEKNGFPFRRWD